MRMMPSKRSKWNHDPSRARGGNARGSAVDGRGGRGALPDFWRAPLTPTRLLPATVAAIPLTAVAFGTQEEQGTAFGGKAK
jgi:hypothetical protein